MAELFGFSFKKNQEKSRAPSPIQPSSDDGATSYIAGGYYGQYLDLDGNFKTEYDMVKKYRRWRCIQRWIPLSKIFCMKQ